MTQNEWEQWLLAASKRGDEAEQQRFLELLDQVSGRVTPAIAKVLMKTFSEAADFGTQERVINTLATAPAEVQLRAELDELPRLLKEAPRWAEALMAEEVEHRPELLQATVRTMPAEVKMSLRQLLNRKDLQDIFPNASRVRV